MAIFSNIKGLNIIQKGFYKDNYLNRKLGRVGMEYDSSNPSNTKDDLIKNPIFGIEKEFEKLLDTVVENKSLKDIILKNKNSVYIEPSTNKVVINNSFYLDLNDNKDFEIGKKYYLRDNSKNKETIDKIVKSFVSDEKKEKSIKEIKDFFERWTKIESPSGTYVKDRFGEKFYNIYLKYNKFKTEDDIKNFLVNSNRTEFYEALKSTSSTANIVIPDLFSARFLFKYNKTLVGNGWRFRDFLEAPGKNGEFTKINTKKRDSVFSLASQIEFAVEDLLGEDKEKIFTNNPDLIQIIYNNEDWNSCYYHPDTKAIEITEKFLKQRKAAVLKENYSTNAKEKYFVQIFLHEIGHSLEKKINTEKSEKNLIEEFNKLLGWKENAQYSIFAEGAKLENQSIIENVSYYARVKRDYKEGYKDIVPSISKQQNLNPNEQIEYYTISEYSNKSASEAFAEYFGFYISGRKNIDKDLKAWKSNKEKFLKNADGAKWFPYTKPRKILDKNEQFFIKGKDVLNYYSEDEIKEMHKIYEESIDYNMRIFEKVKQIVDKL